MKNPPFKSRLSATVRLAIGLELTLLALIGGFSMAGGFTSDQLLTLGFMLIPGKTFYLCLFLLYLLRVNRKDESIPGSYSMVRNVLSGHALLALLLTTLAAVGGILTFNAFQIMLFVLEIVFILFITLILPTFLSLSHTDHFWDVSLALEADAPSPTAGASDLEQIAFFLKTGQTARALPLLEKQFRQKEQSDDVHTTVLLSGELATLEKEIQRGQITVSEARTQLNRIRNAVLVLSYKI